jgi:hypothetical protein
MAPLVELEYNSTETGPSTVLGCAIEIALAIQHQPTDWIGASAASWKAVQNGFLAGGVELIHGSIAGTTTTTRDPVKIPRLIADETSSRPPTVRATAESGGAHFPFNFGQS